MTEEQKRKFQEKFDGWYPTEEQFQYGKEHCNLNWIREEKLKTLDYLLSNPSTYNYSSWVTNVVPILEDLEMYDKWEEEMKELYK